MKFDKLRFGDLRHHYVTEPDDDGWGETRSDDVTTLVRELVLAYNQALRDLTTAEKELKDLKTRKWWDELEMVTDRSGNQVIVRTHYQLEVKGMSLMVSPEMFDKVKVGGLGL